jgi:16S rRNA G527 N7-methylase RsmG
MASGENDYEIFCKAYPPATKCAHDFATGAGFDAIALALSRELEITLLDSRDSKKC